MKIICISDTHNQHEKLNLPEGDLLIHSGDWTNRGTEKEILKFINWLSDQSKNYRNICFCAGNHDWLPEKDPIRFLNIISDLLPNNVHYLQDNYVIIEGLKIWGSPNTPYFCNWAFNKDEQELEDSWENIPEDTDILITHGPPFQILDEVPSDYREEGQCLNVGCEFLKKRVENLNQLKLHVFGHIHYSYGYKTLNGYTTFANAAICDEKYSPSNPPIEIDLEIGELNV